jgi:hypothetical protein
MAGQWRGPVGCLRQQAHVHDLVGDGLLDDHFVLRVDRNLDVVADANLCMGGHARLPGSVSDIWLSPVRSRSASIAFLAERPDLLGKVFRARAAIRSTRDTP